MSVDPVCGKLLEDDQPHLPVDFQGVYYYVCCRLCQAEFERQPSLYARDMPPLEQRTGDPQLEKAQTVPLVYTVTVTRGAAP